MTVWKRLFRKPFTTLLWLVFVALMTGFLSAAAALWYSTDRLSDALDKSHTAIAVRSDPGMARIGGNGRRVTFSYETRSFTQEDVQAIEAMPGVRAVRSHTVTGCSSPTFHPFIDVRRELSWRAKGNYQSYYNAVFAGKLVAKDSELGRHSYSGINDPNNCLFLLFELEDVLLLNDEYAEPLETMRSEGGFSYVVDLSEDPDAASYFVEGERYVVSGIFDPWLSDYGWNISIRSDVRSWAGPVYFTMHGGKPVYRDGYLEDVSERIQEQFAQVSYVDLFQNDMPEPVKVYDENAPLYPAAERYDGDLDAFFTETPHALWRTYRDAWQKQNHAMAAIGTDRLETVFSFLTGDATIIDGRSFTEEEYRTGAKVMVISEITAKLSNLKVGDTVPLSQFPFEGDDLDRLLNSTYQNNPTVQNFRIDRDYGKDEPFTVVGVYHMPAAWTEGTYSFTTNTVFIPRSAQIEGAYPEIEPYREPTVIHSDGETFTMPDDSTAVISGGDMICDDNKDVYGLYVSVELLNGYVEEFQLALENSPYAGQFYVFDQGFETVQRNLIDLMTSTERLLWIAAGGWVLLLLLYLLMYQSAQKKNVGVMRSLGAEPNASTRYLFFSGMLTAAIGIAIGTILSRIALGVVQKNVLSEMLGAIDRTAYGGVLVISEEALGEMVQSSTPGVRTLLLFALAQFGIMGLAVWIHAAIVSHMPPRTLSEG
ncbi:MAG: ABC transporter permease [Clostridia bacterium]|nr:ABC transporter permease [Clostridia bacterium]